MSFRGTARTPGADPTRLPVGLDLRAISIAEGVRAGLAAALPVAASVWLHQPLLGLAALGALLTCICDPGGPLHRRLPILVPFILLGALLIGGFGVIRGAGFGVTVAIAAPALFCTGFLRVWGVPAQALGNLLAVVLLIGTDQTLSVPDALGVAGLFAAGGAWALLLAFAIWRIYPFGPARRAVADVWDTMATYAAMVQDLTAPGSGERSAAQWEAQARAGRGAVRAAIERARVVLMDTAAARGPVSGPATQNLLRLEAADQFFAVLIAMSDELETASGPARATLHRAGARLLRRLRPLLRTLSAATEHEHIDRLDRLDRVCAALATSAGADPVLAPLARVLSERLLIATKLIDPAQYLPGSGGQGDAGVPLWQRLITPVRANLSWQSATMRHALRVCVMVTAALAATLVWQGHYSHWLTITMVLVMQPFFATTWQRTLERVGGTLLGGLVAAALSLGLHSRLMLAATLPVLGAAALALRQVSYAVYISVYTPVVILLVEQIRPADDQTELMLARAGYTVLGGGLAVLANALLWPSWQPEQVRADLLKAIRVHAAYASIVLDLESGHTAARRAAARRAAGLASNNLEASLQRAMHEPHPGQRDRLAAFLVADATLRRIAGRLAALSFAPAPAGNEISAWVPQALEALAAGQQPPERPAPAWIYEPLDRLARQVELLAFTLKGGLLS